MCGIIGYVGKREAVPVLFEGLKNLEYRGYDSCGMAVLNGGISIKKDVGKIEEVHNKLNFYDMNGRTAIAHTRWATHGSVTSINSHPHISCNADVAVVHNGIISNYEQLKRELESEGHRFKSDCDSECLAHLLEDGFRKGYKNIKERAEGSYAFLAISENEQGILAARNGSPLMIGIGEGEYFAASDVLAFLNHTKNVVYLEDGEHAMLGNGCHVFDSDWNKVHKTIETIDWSPEKIGKGGYKHFMNKEICEEPQILKYALAIPDANIKKASEMINEHGSVYLTGMGTSVHAAITARYWFSQNKKRIFSIDSSELKNEWIDDGCLVIALTQSGETKDTLDALDYAKSHGAKTVSIVNSMISSAARKADYTILQSCGPEIAVCATKSFTSQMMILARMSKELGKLNGSALDWQKRLDHVPDYIEEVLKKSEKIRTIVKDYCDVDKYFFIGNGINYPSAKEAALKFKEITYKYAEGMSGGFFKHGTISLIDSDFKTFAFVSEGKNKDDILCNIKEVEARGGKVMKVGFGKDCEINLGPAVEEELTPFVFAAAGQLIAYHYADILGNDVDQPRYLAKSVTVK